MYSNNTESHVIELSNCRRLATKKCWLSGQIIQSDVSSYTKLNKFSSTTNIIRRFYSLVLFVLQWQLVLVLIIFGSEAEIPHMSEILFDRFDIDILSVDVFDRISHLYAPLLCISYV